MGLAIIIIYFFSRKKEKKTNDKATNERYLVSKVFNISWLLFICKQVKQVLDEILEKLPDEFNVQEMMARVEDRTPYTVVAFQECERMNILTSEIKRSLKELDLGLKVSSTISFWNDTTASINFRPCCFSRALRSRVF